MEKHSIDTGKLIDEFSSAQLTYYRPEVQVMKFRYANDSYDTGCYVISDGDYDDCGGFSVETDSFPVVWFDRHLGCWNTNDAVLLGVLNSPNVRSALNMIFGSITISKGKIDRAFWRKIISLCLRHDDSLVNDSDLKVVYERENAVAKQPAVFPSENHDEWQLIPTFASFLSSHKSGW